MTYTYTLNKNEQNDLQEIEAKYYMKPIIIRINQLLDINVLEIASDSENSIKKKYDINYEGLETPLICFVTVNFYDEINNPQQRGMLKFFDRAFLAKNIDLTQITSAESNSQSAFINPLSDIIEFANTQLSQVSN